MLLRSFSLAAILLVSWPAVAAADLSAGLVARWTFSGCSMTDVAGGHHGVLTGPASCVASPVNNVALSFNGIDNVVRVDDHADFDVAAGVTYSFWINPVSQAGTLLNKWVGGYESKTLWIKEDGRVYFYLFPCNTSTAWESKATIPVGRWTHISASFDGSRMTLYVNGAFDSSAAVASPGCDPWDHDGALYLGDAPERRAAGEGWPLFKGAMDDVRIYDRALHPFELRDLYHQTMPPPIAGTALWHTAHTVTCENVTRGTQIVIPSTMGFKWNCEAAGLVVGRGDVVRVTIDGKKY